MTGGQNTERVDMKELIENLELVRYNLVSSKHKEIINKTIDTLNLQKTEIGILIRKKDSLRNEIFELQLEVERLKEIEYMYNSLLE